MTQNSDSTPDLSTIRQDLATTRAGLDSCERGYYRGPGVAEEWTTCVDLDRSEDKSCHGCNARRALSRIEWFIRPADSELDVPRNEADARLIAAAPDLLIAAKEYLERFDLLFETRGLEEQDARLRIAIAKAIGGPL